jgi:hypothetical protein
MQLVVKNDNWSWCVLKYAVEGKYLPNHKAVKMYTPLSSQANFADT